jgi:hypothetical protein
VQVWQTINYMRDETRVELYSDRLAKRDISAGHLKPETMIFLIVEEGPTVNSQAGRWEPLIPLFPADMMAKYRQTPPVGQERPEPNTAEVAKKADVPVQDRPNSIDRVYAQPITEKPVESKNEATSVPSIAKSTAATQAAQLSIPPQSSPHATDAPKTSATPPPLQNQKGSAKPTQTTDPFTTVNEAPARKSKARNESLLVLGILAAFGLLIVWFAGPDFDSTASGDASVCCSDLGMGQHNGLHVRVKANVRRVATSRGNEPVGQMVRGTTVDGKIVQGEDGTSRWLKLSDGSGYLSANVLSTIAGPELSDVIDADRFTVTEVSVRAEPRLDADVRLVLPTGSRYYLVGNTVDGYEEVMVRNTGVQFGYIKTTP